MEVALVAAWVAELGLPRTSAAGRGHAARPRGRRDLGIDCVSSPPATLAARLRAKYDLVYESLRGSTLLSNRRNFHH